MGLIEQNEPPEWLTERERLLYEHRETMARLAKTAKVEADSLRQQLQGAVEALAELAGAVRCYSEGDLTAEDRLDTALDAADRITAGAQ